MEIVLLLVEDDDADAVLLDRAIRKAQVDAQVCRVRDGDEAIDYLAGRRSYADRTLYPPASLVLLDIKLPRRDGFEVIAWLRQQPAPLSRTAVIMLTSSGRPADVNRAYELGANSYIQKPEEHDELVAAISVFKDFWLKRCVLPEVGPGPQHDA